VENTIATPPPPGCNKPYILHFAQADEAKIYQKRTSRNGGL